MLARLFSFTRRRSSSKTKPIPTVSLRLEELESRSLPSATALGTALASGRELLSETLFSGAAESRRGAIVQPTHAASPAASAATPTVGTIIATDTPTPASQHTNQTVQAPVSQADSSPPVYAKLIATTKDSQGNPETYFTDGNNQLWRTDNGVSVNLGAYATRLVAGQGIAVFTDGSNRLYLFSDATNSFTDLGAYATHLAGGSGLNGKQFIFTDGTNLMWSYNASTGAIASIGAYATQISLGFDSHTDVDVWFTDGSNKLWCYANGAFTDTGAYAHLLSGGLNEIAFTDGNNQVFIYSLTASTFINTGAYATRLSGRANADGSAFAITDGLNQLYSMDGNGAIVNTGAYALRINVGQDTSHNMYIWFVDGHNEAWIYENSAVTPA